MIVTKQDREQIIQKIDRLKQYRDALKFAGIQPWRKTTEVKHFKKGYDDYNQEIFMLECILNSCDFFKKQPNKSQMRVS